MSADLFAEFSSTSNSGQQQQQPHSGSGQTRTQPAQTFSFFEDLTATTSAPATQAQTQPPLQNLQAGGFGATQAPVADDNDDWGDFEGGQSSFDPVPPPVKQDPFAFPSAQQSWQPSQTWDNTAPSHQDPFSSTLTQSLKSPQPSQSSWNNPAIRQDLSSFASPQSSDPSQTWQRAPIVKAKKSADPSVLFDAEDDFDDDDDFGEFEGPDSNSNSNFPASTAGSSGLVDLLGDMSVSDSQILTTSERRGSSTQAKTLSSTQKKSVGGFGSVSRAKKSPTTSSESTVKQDDSWDTFDDWEATIPTKVLPKTLNKPKVTKATPSSTSGNTPTGILSPTFDEPQPGELPPTNVPPPGVLLSLFPPLFTEAQNKLFKPMAGQTLPMRNKLLSEPATIAYLQGYLMLASVAARIIAGRKLRWKRDQHLSQGMRIGPASSRATSGMKLTGIDKSENMKEEREAADVVRAWKDQLGRLRHVVSAANQIKASTLGAIPDIQEMIPVRTLKQAEGGVPAREPCMMCGLKRDERATAADMEVDDSFGEWWIDQVNMHRGCRNFWNEHKDNLRQR